jgi:Acetyltransferase (GNAT) domain
MTQTVTRAWTEVPAAEVLTWNGRIRDGGAPLWQLPYWRAFVDRPGLTGHYFAELDPSGEARAWACVMDWGVGPYRVALVQDGPVNLVDPDAPVPAGSVGALCAELRRKGYMLVRFLTAAQTLPSPDDLPRATAGDLFPFFSRDVAELVVPLSTEEKTLAGFQRHARQHIRRAERKGYQVQSGGVELLDDVHRIIRMTALRKGFRVPSQETLGALLTAGADVEGVRLYLARTPGGDPVSGIAVGADRFTWHYLFGGVDPERTLGVSPTPLLHWTAMRDAIARGAVGYNLGAGAPASIAAFKEQFSPIRKPPPESVSVALRPAAAAAWRWGALPVLTTLWPAAQRLRHRLWRRNQTPTTTAAADATA